MESFARISPQVEETDFLSLRLNNAAPTSHDSALIHNIIGTIDNDITHLDQAIAALELELKKLKTNRVALVERRSGYSRLVSPLRSMPLEILGEIFLHASADSLSFRLHTSHVCRLWRDAALGCSALWSTIDGRFPDTAQCLQEYVRACVQRSQSRPLTLITTMGDKVLYDAAGVVLKATKNCSWKEFSWTFLNQGRFEHLIQALASTSADTLQRLTLKADWNPAQPTMAKLDLGTFNKLSSLTISRYSPMTLEIVDAPWPQLTRLSLTVRECGENTLLNILHQCLNLEECMIDIDSLHLEDIGRHRPIHLAKLRKLWLFNSERLFQAVTRVLVTPVLEELAIYHLTEFEITWNMRHDPCIYQYLLDNVLTLRRLWICGVSGVEVADTITQLEFLKELTLGGNNAMLSDTFDSLTSDDVVPLSHLYALTVICEVDSSIQQTFIDFVESRWWHGYESDEDSTDEDSHSRDTEYVCSLRYASLQQKNPDILQGVLRKMEKYKEEGLDINMLNATSSDDFISRFCDGF